MYEFLCAILDLMGEENIMEGILLLWLLCYNHFKKKYQSCFYSFDFVLQELYYITT